MEVGAYRVATVYRIVVLLGGRGPKLWLSQSETFYSHVIRYASLCHYCITMHQLGGETSLQFPYCTRKISVSGANEIQYS